MSERTALYKLFDGSGTLLYVGVTSNPYLRWGQHYAAQPWWKDVAEHQVSHWYDSKKEARAAETELIRTAHPLHNQRGTGETPYHKFRAPAEFWDRVKRVAEEQGRTMTAVILEALERYMDWWDERKDGGE